MANSLFSGTSVGSGIYFPSTTPSNFTQSQTGTFNVASFGSTVSSDISSATTAVSSTVSAVSSTVSNAVSTVSSVASEAQTYVANAISSVSNLFTSTETAVANSVSSVFDSLFSNTNSSTQGNVNTAVPDALSSSFANGTPRSTLFKTSNITSSLDPVVLPGQVSTTSSGSSTIVGSLLTTLTQRFGALASDVTSTITSATHNSFITGLYSDVSSGVNAVSNVVSDAAAGVSLGIADFHALYSSVASSLTGAITGLDPFFNSSYPLNADSLGSPISGIPSDIPTSTLTSLYGASSSIGCNTIPPLFTPFGANQSFYNALLSIASGLGITNLLDQLLSCSNALTSESQNVIGTLFNNNIGTNPSVASSLLNGLSPGSIYGSSSMVSSLLSNPSLSHGTMSSVVSILEKLNISPSSALQTGQVINGQPVWNSGLMSNMSNTSIASLSNDNTIPLMTNGSGVDFSKDFAVGGVY